MSQQSWSWPIQKSSKTTTCSTPGVGSPQLLGGPSKNIFTHLCSWSSSSWASASLAELIFSISWWINSTWGSTPEEGFARTLPEANAEEVRILGTWFLKKNNQCEKLSTWGLKNAYLNISSDPPSVCHLLELFSSLSSIRANMKSALQLKIDLLSQPVISYTRWIKGLTWHMRTRAITTLIKRYLCRVCHSTIIVDLPR